MASSLGSYKAIKPLTTIVEFEDTGSSEHLPPSNKEQSREPADRQYKPTAHRSISFAALAVLLLAAIGILEYGLRILPNSSFGAPENVKADVDKRQATIKPSGLVLAAAPARPIDHNVMARPAAIGMRPFLSTETQPPSSSTQMEIAHANPGIVIRQASTDAGFIPSVVAQPPSSFADLDIEVEPTMGVVTPIFITLSDVETELTLPSTSERDVEDEPIISIASPASTAGPSTDDPGTTFTPPPSSFAEIEISTEPPPPPTHPQPSAFVDPDIDIEPIQSITSAASTPDPNTDEPGPTLTPPSSSFADPEISIEPPTHPPPSSFADPDVDTEPTPRPPPIIDTEDPLPTQPQSSFADPEVVTVSTSLLPPFPSLQPSSFADPDTEAEVLTSVIGNAQPSSLFAEPDTMSESSYADSEVATESTTAIATGSDVIARPIVTTGTPFTATPAPDSYAATFISTAPDGIITTITNSPAHTGIRMHTSAILRESTIVLTDGSSLTTVVSTYTSVEISTSTPEPASGPTPQFSEKPLQFINRPIAYFGGMYLPLILAAIIQILLGYLYSSTKMMEPFYELNKGTRAANFLWSNYLDSNDLLAPFYELNKGTRAANFLWSNYLDSNDLLAPFYAFNSRQWPVLTVSISYLLAQFVPPFSSELIDIVWSRTRIENGFVRGNALWISSPVARIAQALLGAIFILLSLSWILISRQRSGIYDDPSSIATVASLLGHPHLTNSFKVLDANCEKSEISRYLGDSLQYKLSTFGSSRNQYGIVPVARQNSLMTDTEYNLHEKASNEYIKEDYSASLPHPSPEKKGLRAVEILLITLLTLSILGTLGLTVAYYKSSDPNTGFERFMSSDSFGPRFIFTLIGIFIKMQWSRLERLAVTNAPFWKLYEAPCTTETIIKARSLDPFSAFFKSLFGGSFYLFTVSFNTVLSEFLVILLPGIPFARGQLYAAAKATWISSMALLAFMSLSMIAVWLQKTPPWPRAPNTVGALVLYLADTGPASDLSVFAETGGNVRDREILSWGKRYRFVKVPNGQFGTRWIIEYVDSPEAEMLLSERR